MMRLPIILSFKTLKHSGEINEAYANAIKNCGGELRMFETTEEIDAAIDQADGVLLPGGVDVNPGLYGEERRVETQPPHNERDRFEMYLLERAIEKRIPILGICRGLQVINVKQGGTLYQDIEKEMPGSIRHDWHHDEEGKAISRSQLTHSVSIQEGSEVHAILQQGKVEVNSLHHQGIKDLGKGLVASGHSLDGLIEAIEMPDYPYLIGVQWHPEELCSDPLWDGFMRNFVEVCA